MQPWANVHQSAHPDGPKSQACSKPAASLQRRLRWYTHHRRMYQYLRARLHPFHGTLVAGHFVGEALPRLTR